jgi:hypothetical protein
MTNQRGNTMIELNGIANIKLLMDHMYKNSEGLDYKSFAKIETQVEVLHQYLKEVAIVMSINHDIIKRTGVEPIELSAWHEVREKTLKKS